MRFLTTVLLLLASLFVHAQCYEIGTIGHTDNQLFITDGCIQSHLQTAEWRISNKDGEVHYFTNSPTDTIEHSFDGDYVVRCRIIWQNGGQTHLITQCITFTNPVIDIEPYYDSYTGIFELPPCRLVVIKDNQHEITDVVLDEPGTYTVMELTEGVGDYVIICIYGDTMETWLLTVN